MSFLFSFSSPATSSEELVSLRVERQIRSIEACGPVSSAEGVANAYNATQHNNVSSDAMKKKIVRSDDSNARGKYHTIDTDEWEEVESHVVDENRIGVGRDLKFIDATVFIQIREEGRTEECANYVLFHKKDWFEYRKERGEKKYQEPMISGNGIIWVGDTKEVYGFRVFIPVVKN
jgi:hypothetical protein